MATTPPLHGMRIIECSALGPAAITTPLVDLGADVIKVEPPAGDYIREMTWPIVEGVSLMHLHLNRGKRSLVLDLRTEAGVAIFKELADRAPTSSSRRCGPARWPGAASGYDDLRVINPKIVFCTISGYGMTGPYRDYPSHGVAYDTWAGIVNVATDDEGFTYIPEHVSIGINAAPALRRARHPGRRDPGPRHRRRLLHRAGPVRCRGRHGLVPLRDLAGLRATRVRGDRQQVRRLRAAGPGHGGHGRGRPLPGLRGVRRASRPLHGLGAGVLEELLRGRRPHGPLRALARVQVRRPRPGQPRAPARAARHLPDQDGRGVAGVRRAGQHADRAGQHAQDPARRPAVRRPVPAAAGVGGRRRPALHARCTSSARSCRTPAKAPTVGQHTEDVLRSVLGYDDNQIASARDEGAFGADA